MTKHYHVLALCDVNNFVPQDAGLFEIEEVNEVVNDLIQNDRSTAADDYVKDFAERVEACLEACHGIEPAQLAELAAIVASLPKTADGFPVVPGMTVYCIVGEQVDERTVIGPYGKLALLTHEPARHGAGDGSCHRLATTVYASREFAVARSLHIRQLQTVGADGGAA